MALGVSRPEDVAEQRAIGWFMESSGKLDSMPQASGSFDPPDEGLLSPDDLGV